MLDKLNWPSLAHRRKNQTDHNVQDRSGVSGSTDFIPHSSGFPHQSQSYLQVQEHIGILSSLRQISLPSNSPWMEQPQQRHRWSTFSELLQEPSTVVRRTRRWRDIPTSGTLPTTFQNQNRLALLWHFQPAFVIWRRLLDSSLTAHVKQLTAGCYSCLYGL